ncbi:hypothetical protein BMW22_13995 [Rhizobium leguminosarum]|uniref:EF-hand domain-containing protein n=2 Tax=Rhizobium leguminosarum TaxID=384 RepID=A0A1L3ZA63_RHILE|nr:hypothetical protein BMW22_13995 [Rhizobium leguminosarum]
MAQLFQPFRASAGPDRVLRQEDIERSKQIAAARQRASGVAAFFSSDLDGDGRLTLAEFKDAQEQSWYETSIDISSELGQRFAKLDLDGNGTVTFEEAKAAAEKPGQPESGRDVAGRLQQLLAVDPNQDGTLTAAELEQLGRAAFAYYDRDKDGVRAKRKGRLSPLKIRKTTRYCDASKRLHAACSRAQPVRKRCSSSMHTVLARFPASVWWDRTR